MLNPTFNICLGCESGGAVTSLYSVPLFHTINSVVNASDHEVEGLVEVNLPV